MKKLKKSFVILVCFVLVFFQPLLVFSEENYIIKESELVQLEQNNQEMILQLKLQKAQLTLLKSQLQTLELQTKNLKDLQSQTMQYCNQLEKDKKTILSIGIPLVFISFFGGMLLGLSK